MKYEFNVLVFELKKEKLNILIKFSMALTTCPFDAPIDGNTLHGALLRIGSHDRAVTFCSTAPTHVLYAVLYKRFGVHVSMAIREWRLL